MATSLETRAPFLDHNIIELAWRLPLELKIKNNSGKLILRNILENYVPNSLMERPKVGFGLPLKDWLRGPLREWAEDLLDETRMTEEGFFYAAPIQSLWREHIYNQADYTEFLWSILMFQAWLREAKSS
jgi:asparagine synthase (glutamine-hydrolysing)